MSKLRNKTALITGGSRGIGASIAKAFAIEGAKVFITYNSSPDKANDVVKEIEALGGVASAIKVDASKPEQISTVFKDVLALIDGNIDILVNNAGIGAGGKIGSEDAGLDAFDEVLNVNVRSVYALTHAAVTHMNDGGRIINISSILGERGIFPDMGIYNASKFAVTGLTRSWAHDLGDRNITVNAIQPGPINTDMNPEEGSDMADITALKRYGQPPEVAALAVFLASDGSSYITGATMNVDGGANA